MDNPTPNPTPVPTPARTTSNAAPAAQPAAPALSAEAQTMFNQFTMIDPQREGVSLDKLRPFYGRVGWSKLLTPANELVASGRLSKRAVMNGKGTVAYEVYTWKEA